MFEPCSHLAQETLRETALHRRRFGINLRKFGCASEVVYVVVHPKFVANFEEGLRIVGFEIPHVPIAELIARTRVGARIARAMMVVECALVIGTKHRFMKMRGPVGRGSDANKG